MAMNNRFSGGEPWSGRYNLVFNAQVVRDGEGQSAGAEVLAVCGILASGFPFLFEIAVGCVLSLVEGMHFGVTGLLFILIMVFLFIY